MGCLYTYLAGERNFKIDRLEIWLVKTGNEEDGQPVDGAAYDQQAEVEEEQEPDES